VEKVLCGEPGGGGVWGGGGGGGFKGVWTNPPCSLAKFLFNETAAVQGTIIQPCSGIITDSIQVIMQLLQGVVTYMSPVEAFATEIKNFDK